MWITINDTGGNGRKASAVNRIRAVWQEDDDGFEGEFPLEPSVVVETSPGHFHRYWLVAGEWPADEQGRRDFAGVMACMVANYGSDKGAKDISRVLRMPGFLHRKNSDAPHMVAIVGGNRRRYTRAEILAAFPPPEKTSAPRGNGRAGDGYSEAHSELVRQVLTGENYHSALVSLAWRQIYAGMPAGQAVEHLRGIMLSIPDERRDERWSARYAEIPRLVSSAEDKQEKTTDAPGGLRPSGKPKKPRNPRKRTRDKQPYRCLDTPDMFDDDKARGPAHKDAAGEPRPPPDSAAIRNKWQEGAELLDQVHAFLGRFVAYPSEHARVAHTLWIAHTHLMDAWESTPRLSFLSPEPASGKTRALEASEPLVPRSVEAVNVSPAYLIRKVADDVGRPTILFDELDTVFGPKAKENEEIRGLLNAGHRKGAVAGRCIVAGNQVKTEEIPAYCAVALAGLGGLPDTILTRSVVIRMRRRAPDEQVEAWRRRIHAKQGEAIRDQLAVWAEDVVESVTEEWPEMPLGVTDRDADVWEPLLAVADVAGGVWPNRARVAAVALVAESKESTPSLGVRLLTDLQTVFGAADKLATTTILRELHEMAEAPWVDLRGKPLNDHGLSKFLKNYSIRPKRVRIGEGVFRGYDRQDFYDAWKRYLPPQASKPATPATEVPEVSQANGFAGDGLKEPEPLHPLHEKREKPGDVAPVAGVAPLSGDETDDGGCTDDDELFDGER